MIMFTANDSSEGEGKSLGLPKMQPVWSSLHTVSLPGTEGVLGRWWRYPELAFLRCEGQKAAWAGRLGRDCGPPPGPRHQLSSYCMSGPWVLTISKNTSPPYLKVSEKFSGPKTRKGDSRELSLIFNKGARNSLAELEGCTLIRGEMLQISQDASVPSIHFFGIHNKGQSPSSDIGFHQNYPRIQWVGKLFRVQNEAQFSP